jgi:hypothetical protein
VVVDFQPKPCYTLNMKITRIAVRTTPYELGKPTPTQSSTTYRVTWMQNDSERTVDYTRAQLRELAELASGVLDLSR